MFVALAILSAVVVSAYAGFEVPDAKVEVFHPRGLKVSIPDRDGIKLFAFHGKINEEFEGREGGYFSKDVLEAKDGRWTFYDPIAKLKVGDTLYYWTYVDYFDGERKLGYPKDDQLFVVRELLDKKTHLPVAPTVTQPQGQTTPASGCKIGITEVNGRTVCAGSEILNEEFSTLNNNIWTREVKFATEQDFEFVVYANRPENLKIQDSFLKIQPLPSDELYGKGFSTSPDGLNLGNNCTGVQGTPECEQKPAAYLILPPVASARISTKSKLSFKYGKVEIRAKLPKGDWIYPEFYLDSSSEQYGPGYQSGQIRIAFLGGNDDLSDTLYGGCIVGTSEAAREFAMRSIRKTSDSWTNEFHKYSLIWDNERISVIVDDRLYGTIYPPEGGFAQEAQNLNLENVDRLRKGSAFAPFDKEMYLTIGVGVGGHSFGDQKYRSKPWLNGDPKSQRKFYKAQHQWRQTWSNASALEVDYIKIWAL